GGTMKYIFLGLLFLAPKTTIGSETLEASPLVPSCEQCANQRGASLLSTDAMKTVSTLANANEISRANRSTSSTSWFRPKGVVRYSNGEMVGFYVGTCTFVTVGHQGRGRPVNSVIQASNEFDSSGRPINFHDLTRIAVSPEREMLRGDSVIYNDSTCSGQLSGYFDLDAIQDETEVVLDGLEGATAKCKLLGVRGREVLHDCPSAPGDSGGPIVGTDSIESPQLGRAGIPIWSAVGMHSGFRGTEKIGVSAAAIKEYAGGVIKADLDAFIAKSKSVISSMGSRTR
ncbi:MAG: hypothetical protein K2X47_15700, partial [Bdellovibrionales bacterium]|nr:hypothetical protein [Bdellovibrionales bacterium]